MKLQKDSKIIPRDPCPEATLPLLLQGGYEYILKTSRRLNTDVFETRLMLQKTICVTGEEAAKVFYDPILFKRTGAVPRRILKTLLGKGGVHGLDGEAHHDRKLMFLSFMLPDKLGTLLPLMQKSWEKQTRVWEKKRKSVALYDESQIILCRAICQWSGIPISERELPKRARDLAAMVDAFGAVGPRFWRGRLARLRTERWITEVIRKVRSGKLHVPEGCAAEVISFHRGINGELLPTRVAAVELINVIRPTVAVSYLIAFAGLALKQYPEERRKVQEGSDQELVNFVNEVRRFYPFAPLMGAIARKDFEWKGYLIPKGRLVVLDLYGINHDPRVWKNAGKFDSDHFRTWNGSAYNFVPQGGGDPFMGHRCAGEWITIEAMKIAVDYLTSRIEYNLPEQDFRYSLLRMPTFPRSRIVINRIRRLAGQTPTKEGKAAA